MSNLKGTSSDKGAGVKSVNGDDYKETKEEKKARRKEKAKQKGQVIKDYAKKRWQQVVDQHKAAVELIMDIDSPSKWINVGKAAVKGEKDNLVNLKDLIKGLINHPSYYTHYKELLNTLITPNFSRIGGIVDDKLQGTIFRDISTTVWPFSDACLSVPRVARIALSLVRGSDARTYRLAIDRLFQAVQNANNGNPVGSLEDYAEMIAIHREIIALIEEGRRAYGTLQTFNLMDESVPMAYFAAYGLDYDTFKTNAANLRNILNNAITELNSRAMFNLDLFNRTISLFRGHYADNPTLKHQVYVFTPESCLVPEWQEEGDDATWTSVNLNWDNVNNDHTGMYYTQYVNLLQQAMNKLTQKPEYSNIRANIIKAYGLDLFTLPLIEEDYNTTVLYSEYMLQAIQNTTLIGESIYYTDNLDGHFTDYYLSNDEVLTYTGSDTFGECLFEGNYINIKDNSITNEEFISNTRLTVTGESYNTTGLRITDFGTEVAHDIGVPMITTQLIVSEMASSHVAPYDIVMWRYSRITPFYDFNLNSGMTTIAQPFMAAYLWSVFDWHPMINLHVFAYDEKNEQWDCNFFVPMWDFANYGYITKTAMPDYHKIAVRNLYYANLVYKDIKTEVIPAERF